MSNTIPTIIKLNNLRNAIDLYKGQIDAIELNTHDLRELKLDEHFENYFKVTTDVMGIQYLNKIRISHSPLIARGTFYFKHKL